MTGPRGDQAPEFVPLGNKIEKPKPAEPVYRPDPDADPDHCIEIGPDGKRRTNDPRNGSTS